MMYYYAEKCWQLTPLKLSGKQYREQKCGKQLFITLNKLKTPPSRFQCNLSETDTAFQPKSSENECEQKASGISREMSELDGLMEELTGLEDMSEEEKANESEEKHRKTEQDRVKALDMRKKAMEKLSETTGRKLQAEN